MSRTKPNTLLLKKQSGNTYGIGAACHKCGQRIEGYPFVRHFRQSKYRCKTNYYHTQCAREVGFVF